jgi:nicotinate phosphoribosyltransferase
MDLYKAGSAALLTDLYELTMMQGYFHYRRDRSVVFDYLFRREPFGGGYTVFAGLEPLVRSLLGLRFSAEDLAYLARSGLFRKDFMEYLARFSFNGDIYAVEEGETVFPREPLVRVHASLTEAQFIESLLLNILNYQTLIATKAARIVEAAGGRSVMEFGLRRAQGGDGALSGSRAAYIGGAGSTSNVLAGRVFGIPVAGTMAHSWVMSFGSEAEAFRAYARLYPENTILLVDTYDTLQRGIPAAIKVLQGLKRRGVARFGIRLDSGDLEYMSKRARYMLDEAGLQRAVIVASNELDEHIIEQLVSRHAPIDIFGVGTKLITAEGDPALTGIYKLVAAQRDHRLTPRIKVSNAPEKTTSPHVKNLLRIYGNDGEMLGDLIFLESERRALENSSARKKPLVLHHPEYGYERVTVSDYAKANVLLKPIVKRGKPVYDFPSLATVQQRARQHRGRLHWSYRRLLNPHVYKVSVTRRLFDLRLQMIRKYG